MHALSRCELFYVSGGNEDPAGFICLANNIPIYGVFSFNGGFCVATNGNFYGFIGASAGTENVTPLAPLTINVGFTPNAGAYLTGGSITLELPGFFIGTNLDFNAQFDTFATGQHFGFDASLNYSFGMQLNLETDPGLMGAINFIGCEIQNGTIRVNDSATGLNINWGNLALDTLGFQASQFQQCLANQGGLAEFRNLSQALSGHLMPAPIVVQSSTAPRPDGTTATEVSVHLPTAGPGPDTPVLEEVIVTGIRETNAGNSASGPLPDTNVANHYSGWNTQRASGNTNSGAPAGYQVDPQNGALVPMPTLPGYDGGGRGPMIPGYYYSQNDLGQIQRYDTAGAAGLGFDYYYSAGGSAYHHSLGGDWQVVGAIEWGDSPGDPGYADYVCETICFNFWDPSQYVATQQAVYDQMIDDLLARTEAGDTLAPEEQDILFTHFLANFNNFAMQMTGTLPTPAASPTPVPVYSPIGGIWGNLNWDWTPIGGTTPTWTAPPPHHHHHHHHRHRHRHHLSPSQRRHHRRRMIRRRAILHTMVVVLVVTQAGVLNALKVMESGCRANGNQHVSSSSIQE